MYSWQFLSSLMFTSNNAIHSLVSDHIMLKNLNFPSFFLLLVQEAMLTIGPVGNDSSSDELSEVLIILLGIIAEFVLVIEGGKGFMRDA